MQMVSKIEQDARRVDADDLIALALVLGVNANSILLNRRARRTDVLDLTATFRQRADVVWDWADGREPMPAHQVDEGGVVRRTLAEQLEFAATARPALAARLGHSAALAIGQLAAAVQGILLYLDEGDGDEPELGKRRTEVRRALQRVVFELDGLLGDEGNGQG
jgi:transcriptional regulator with XRE-family HTH domain